MSAAASRRPSIRRVSCAGAWRRRRSPMTSSSGHGGGEDDMDEPDLPPALPPPAEPEPTPATAAATPAAPAASDREREVLMPLIKDIDEREMPLLDHLVELRNRLVYSAIAILAGLSALLHVRRRHLRLPGPSARQDLREHGDHRPADDLHRPDGGLLHLHQGRVLGRRLHHLPVRRRPSSGCSSLPACTGTRRRRCCRSWRPRRSCSSPAAPSSTISSSPWPGTSSSASRPRPRARASCRSSSRRASASISTSS